MTHKTRGIVIRAVKYGETSLVVTILTEMFGLQSYMVNGVRKQQQSAKAAMLQPASILDLEVYHSEHKNLHRIKEYSRALLYENLFTDVVRHSISTYIIELMLKSVRQPEQNTDLYQFCEDVLLHLDRSPSSIAANLPLFFTIQLAILLGFGLEPPLGWTPDENMMFLDLQEGTFLHQQPEHHAFLEGEAVSTLLDLTAVMHPDELSAFKLNKDKRRILLNGLEIYYRFHVNDFGSLKTIKIMQDVLGA